MDPGPCAEDDDLQPSEPGGGGRRASLGADEPDDLHRARIGSGGPAPHHRRPAAGRHRDGADLLPGADGPGDQGDLQRGPERGDEELLLPQPDHPADSGRRAGASGCRRGPDPAGAGRHAGGLPVGSADHRRSSGAVADHGLDGRRPRREDPDGAGLRSRRRRDQPRGRAPCDPERRRAPDRIRHRPAGARFRSRRWRAAGDPRGGPARPRPRAGAQRAGAQPDGDQLPASRERSLSHERALLAGSRREREQGMAGDGGREPEPGAGDADRRVRERLDGRSGGARRRGERRRLRCDLGLDASEAGEPRPAAFGCRGCSLSLPGAPAESLAAAASASASASAASVDSAPPERVGHCGRFGRFGRFGRVGRVGRFGQWAGGSSVVGDGV